MSLEGNTNDGGARHARNPKEFRHEFSLCSVTGQEEARVRGSGGEDGLLSDGTSLANIRDTSQYLTRQIWQRNHPLYPLTGEQPNLCSTDKGRCPKVLALRRH
jgi:hypothetical protein